MGLSAPLFWTAAGQGPQPAPNIVTAKPLYSSLYKAPEANRVAALSTIQKGPEARLAFEQTRGQTNAEEEFTSCGGPYGVVLSSEGATLALHSAQNGQHSRAAEPSNGTACLRIYPIGANPKPKMRGINELTWKSNYFIGKDPQKWRQNVPNYHKVKYENVYPGTDMEYYFSHDNLEYDFILSPGSDPESIVVGYEGHKDMRIDENGDLQLELAGLSIRQHRPSVYQVRNGVRRDVTARYVERRTNAIGISLGDYDKQEPLVIDPVLTYSSYIGGNLHDEATGIAVDSSGSVYVTGITNSSDLPTTVPAYQTAFKGSGTDYDVFVMKWSPNLTDLVYATYLGGTGTDWGYGITVDSDGNAFVTGATQSGDFPVTPGAFQTHFHDDFGDAFVSKLNRSGSALIYSTYLGGSDPQHRTHDIAYGIAIDQAGDAYVAGETQSNDFPTTPGAPQTSRRGISDAFVTKLNTTGTALLYSTYLGGSDEDFAQKIAVDTLGNAYLTGVTASDDFPATPGAFQSARKGQADVFVTKMNSDGTGFAYSTYLGGRVFDKPGDIAVDSLGSAYVTGYTQSTDFPTTPGSLEPSVPSGTCTYPCTFSYAFITKFTPDGSALVYSTYLGGSGGWGSGIAVDDLGSVYVTGGMDQFFEVTADAFQQSHAGSGDAFVAKLDRAGSKLLYSTYLGGSSGDSGTCIAVDAGGNIYLGGTTYSTNFPVSTTAFQRSLIGGQFDTDAFISKLSNVPQIFSISLTGKRLTLTGRDFSGGAVILLNGSPQTTANDKTNPTNSLIARRAGKRIGSGQTVSLQVRNADGTLSNQFSFTRP